MMFHRIKQGAIAVVLLVGCGAEPDSGEEVATSTDAYSATSGDFVPVPAPPGLPEVWDQPLSEGAFDRYGKCGQTAIANLLRLHDVELSPDQIFEWGVRSPIGLFPADMTRFFTSSVPTVRARSAHADARDPLSTIRAHLEAQQGLAIVMGVSGVNAHWFTVVGIRDAETKAPRLVVTTWGGYSEISFAIVERNWRSVITFGQYPYVVLERRTTSPLFVE